jgi:hypothetical protein
MTDVLSRKYDELLKVVQQHALQIRNLEENILTNSVGWAGQQTNVTADRAFDADTVVVAELADVVGTLISDLVETRVLS